MNNQVQEKKPEVYASYDALREEVSFLDVAINELVNKIKPILTSTPESKPEEALSKYNCELANAIHQTTSVVAILRKNVMSAIERTEL
jgi:hypothetical protein